MPIENLNEETISRDIILHSAIFTSSNVVVAGHIKVKHPLLDKSLLLYGFVIEDLCFNENDFKIQNMFISYLYGGNYEAFNRYIYPKIIIDNNQNPFYKLFTDMKEIKRASSEGWYDCSIEKYKYESDEDLENRCKFKYYMFDDITANIPRHAADKIFAVCKYNDDGIFKYALFSLHELMSES